MVDFVDVENMAAWISNQGLDNVLAGVTGYIEEDFRNWTAFDKSPRVASHSTHGVIELMPTANDDTYGFKYVNGHPINTKRGLQTVTAFGLLADVDSGYPTFLAEMTLLTAVRTAATSAMAAKLLAPRSASVMAMIGTGAQSEFQALAMRKALGVNTLRVWDTDPEAVEKLVNNLAPLGFEVIEASNAQDVLDGAHIITTCTADKTNATILSDDMVATGVHINAIGGDCPGKTELDSALLRRSDIFVEYPEQTRIEGEIQQLEDDYPVIELWQVLTGEQQGRTSDDQITIFDSVGFAIEDFSALRYVRDNVTGTSFSTKLDMIAEPQDPKNLFSLLPSGNG